MRMRAEIEARLKRYNERVGHYMPPPNTWTPADESWQPLDLLRVPVDDAQPLQFKAIKYAFTRQYTVNDWYRKFCDRRGVTPDDLKTNADLDKIPLIPDLVFKQHPSGVDFAHWIANVYTGELPTVTIDAEPTFDDIINAFNAAGLVVTHSTGTSGHHSVIPRDRKTFNTFAYATGKAGLSLFDSLSVDHTLTLFPRPAKTNLWAGRSQEAVQEALKDHNYALNFTITADLSARAMTGAEQRESAKEAAREQVRKIFTNGIEWLERYEKTTDTVGLVAPPALFSALMDLLDHMGQTLRLRRGGVNCDRRWLENARKSARRIGKLQEAGRGGVRHS